MEDHELYFRGIDNKGAETYRASDELDIDVDLDAMRDSLIDRGNFKFHACIKAAGEESDGRRVISGYANTRSLDRVNEIVEPGAFRGTLKQWMKNPVILADHWPSVSNVVGRATEATIDDKGFFIKAEIAKGPEQAEIVWSLVQQKMLKAFSIGYRILKDEMVDAVQAGKEVAGRVRKILKLELYEVSIVAIPANRESLFSIAKAMQFGTDMMAPAPPQSPEIKHENEYGTLRDGIRSINDEIDAGLALRELRRINESISKR